MEISFLFYLIFFLIVLFSSIYLYLRYSLKVNEVSCEDFEGLVSRCLSNKENFTNVFLMEECNDRKPGYYDIIYVDGKCITIHK